MKNDITIIFLTNNELPKEWAKFHLKTLLDAVNGAPIITISRKPTVIGTNPNLLQTEPKSPSNVYWQLLRGAKIAKTKYIAVAEDDTLYSKEHFEFRPKKYKIAYNMNHWSLFTWGEPVYNWRNRKGNYSMLGEREFIIEALEERFAKYPNGTPDKITGEIGRAMVERNLGITERKAEQTDYKQTI